MIILLTAVSSVLSITIPIISPDTLLIIIILSITLKLPFLFCLTIFHFCMYFDVLLLLFFLIVF